MNEKSAPPSRSRPSAKTAPEATVVPLTEADSTTGTKIMTDNTTAVVSFAKQNLEALTTASKIWTAGVQDLTAQFTTTAKASLEESVAALKTLTGMKSVKEAIEFQTAYSKSMVAKTLAETKRLTDASLKLTEQAMAPITARMAETVTSLSKAA